MFKLTREKYIAAYESAKQLEDALRKENEKLQESSRNLSRKWWGSQAEQSLGNINESLETGNHAKALAYAAGMTSIMEEYLPGIEKMMAKREQLWKQLKQDEYAAPDLSCFYEDELIINYDYIEDIKADVEGALLYGDKAIQILEEMIEEAEECAGEYVNLGSVKEMVEEGRKKLHRLENYRDEFVDFAKQMKDLEYNMSMDLSRLTREYGDEVDTDKASNMMNTSHSEVVQVLDKRSLEIGLLYQPVVDVQTFMDNLIRGGKAIVPQVVDNEVVFFAFHMMREHTNWISEEKIEENALENRNAFTNGIRIITDNSFIENQSEWGDIQFGDGENTNMRYSGCGIIATYNALVELGRKPTAETMVKLISEFERDGAAMNGEFGVAPSAVYDYFEREGYQVKMITSTDIDKINEIGEESEVIIATVYNN